jgi:iron complex outermembrane receptor protein
MLIFTVADAARFSSESIAETTACNRRFERTDGARVVFPSQSSRAIRLLLLGCLIAPLCAFSQSTDQAPADAAALAPSASKTPAPPQVVPRVTTTVVVHDEVNDGYLPEAVTVGTLDGASLKETPLSVMEVTRELLDDQGARLLSDVVKNDASVGEDYAPVGYFGDYQIRGYALDQNTGFLVNGLTVVGQQNVPLENKQSVEILKGISSLESGMASGGGLIDYVTKRPATIQAVDTATDQRGSSYGAVDMGRFFGSRKQVGARVNLAGERMMSYVNGADGWRAVGAGSTDWKISPKAILKGDFEYQHADQRSVCGYQLLGQEQAADEPPVEPLVPNLALIHPSTMLGEQSWQKPNIFDTTNSNARFDYDLADHWTAFAAASYSHSLRDDNVVYAYGCGYEAECAQNPGPGQSAEYFFAPDGTYDAYDWREPGVLLINAQAEAIVTGHVKMGAVTHDLTVGGELFRMSAQEPGFDTYANPSTAVITDGPVYDYVGSENIYSPVQAFPLESPVQSAGPRRLYEDNRQASFVVQDRIHLPGHIQLFAGGRADSLHDHNYSTAATSPCTPTPNNVLGATNDPCPASYDSNNQPTYYTPTLPVPNNRLIWLPQYAVTFNPLSSLTLYGNYGVLLSLAPQASWFTDNGNQYLSPFFTRQAEVGAKYELDRRILLTTAFFHMRAPFFYPKVIQAPDGFCPINYTTGSPVNPGDLCFEAEGHDTHDGIELNAEGRVTNWLRLTASAAATRAISDDTGTAAFDNKQVLNVPHLRTTLFADLLLPHAHGLHLMPGWAYTGRKEATRDDAVSVSGYNLFNLGARYTPGGEGGHVTLRLYADNITDKRYWKDTGSSGGDMFIHLGAPTTVRLSAHYTF